MRRSRPFAVVGLSVLLVGSAAPSPAAASESSVYAGACAMSGDVTFSPGLAVEPTPQALSIGVTGVCHVNLSLFASGGFHAGGPTVGLGMSCVAGAAVLAADFDLIGDPPLPSVSDGTAVVVNVGGVLVVAFSWELYRFVAVGSLVPTDASPALCLTGTRQTTTAVAGAFALEDPTLPVG